jgi:hypothetical protein
MTTIAALLRDTEKPTAESEPVKISSPPKFLLDTKV